jgi:hypothetical protein
MALLEPIRQIAGHDKPFSIEMPANDAEIVFFRSPIIKKNAFIRLAEPDAFRFAKGRLDFFFTARDLEVLTSNNQFPMLP